MPAAGAAEPGSPVGAESERDIFAFFRLSGNEKAPQPVGLDQLRGSSRHGLFMSRAFGYLLCVKSVDLYPLRVGLDFWNSPSLYNATICQVKSNLTGMLLFVLQKHVSESLLNCPRQIARFLRELHQAASIVPFRTRSGS
jgi:hypothetical protein